MPDPGVDQQRPDVPECGPALDVLRLARKHVRLRTRTPTYMEHADRFSEQFLGKSLGVGSEYWRAVGTDATIIDFYYEHLMSDAENAAPILRATTRQLRQMVDLPVAARVLPAIRTQLELPACPLLDVACGILAAITTLGHASLSRRVSGDVADGWLVLWQEYVQKQNRQQEISCALCLLTQLPAAARPHVMATLDISPEDLWPKGSTFAAGVRGYLAAFAETGALALALIGGIPFGEKLSNEDLKGLICFLKTTPEFLELMTGLLRFAQDVSFDHAEPVSTGVVALAAERGVSIVDRDARQLPRVEIEEKLRREWDVYYRESREHMDTILAALPRPGALHQALTGLVESTWTIADLVTMAPHKE